MSCITSAEPAPGRRVGPIAVLAGRAQWRRTRDEAPVCMRYRGLAQPRGTVPPISQRPLRRSATYQGQERSPALRSTGSPGGSGLPAPWPKDLLFANWPGFPPNRVAPSTSSAGGSELSCHQLTGVSPKPKAQVFPSPGGSELSSRYAARGFPSATQFEVFPSPAAQSFLLVTRLGVSPPPHTSKSSLRQWPEVPPCGFPSCQVAPGFPRDQRPQSLPNTGWPGVSPEPVAPDFSLPESPELSFAGWLGFPLRRLPSLVVKKFLRLSARLHKRFWAAISRFFGRPQAIHS
jgi:hypothetical protein